MTDSRREPQLADLQFAEHRKRPADVVDVIVRHDHRGQAQTRGVDHVRHYDSLPGIEPPIGAASGVHQQVGSVRTLQRDGQALPDIDHRSFQPPLPGAGGCAQMIPGQSQAQKPSGCRSADSQPALLRRERCDREQRVVGAEKERWRGGDTKRATIPVGCKCADSQ